MLRFFSTKRLWHELLKREGFQDAERPPYDSVVTEAFNRVPLLRSWFRNREIMLLKALTLGEKTNDFVLGQIYESRLLQRYDIPTQTLTPKVELEQPKRKTLGEFLKGWNGNTKLPSENSTESGRTARHGTEVGDSTGV